MESHLSWNCSNELYLNNGLFMEVKKRNSKDLEGWLWKKYFIKGLPIIFGKYVSQQSLESKGPESGIE